MGPPLLYALYSVHCVQSHIIGTYSKGFPFELVANHMAYTAGAMPAVADIAYLAARLCTISTLLVLSDVGPYVGFKPSRHSPGEVGLKIDLLNCVLTACDEIFKFLRRRPRALLAFAVALLMWDLK